MTEDVKRRLQKAHEKIAEKSEIIKISRLCLRDALGLGSPFRDRLFERQGEFMELQHHRQQNQRAEVGNPRLTIEERFPILKGFFQPLEPTSQNPEIDVVEQERRQQLLEDAQRRQQLADEKKRKEEQHEALERAKNRMSVQE